ncbi:MAPEG family protein [Litoreibacter roseus]|uniref:MAPEG family protein n=1 Tax=Litoreibacter roseus TaxID=2601869 RepID=A0A6N6JH88_9RHOB|nr:MAPEG family protein [Litoreibacter roseus]GFE65713.1 hypothetical protein KIN_27870 [Litoreibacter roseus]
MTLELWSVFVTGGMLWLSIVIQQIHLDKIGGTAYALSNRADPPPDSPAQARMLRAVHNQSHVAAAWIALVIVQQLSGSSGALTYWAALAMIVSRLTYFPLYALGITPFRSFSWALFLFAVPVFGVGVILGLDAVGVVAGQ